MPPKKLEKGQTTCSKFFLPVNVKKEKSNCKNGKVSGIKRSNDNTTNGPAEKLSKNDHEPGSTSSSKLSSSSAKPSTSSSTKPCLSSKTLAKLSNFSYTEEEKKEQRCKPKSHNSHSTDCDNTAQGSKTTQSGNKKLTPLEKQFVEIKEQYPECLLLVECGYKYRFFGGDAEKAAKVLNIFCHLDHNFMTASIPTHRMFVHVRRLTAQGYKVGVVKQTETAGIKAASDNKSSLFGRKLDAVYTRATLIGEDLSRPDGGQDGEDTIVEKNNTKYILCVWETVPSASNKRPEITLLAIDPSTGNMVYDSFTDNSLRSQLDADIAMLKPVEILIPTTVTSDTEKVVLQQLAISERYDEMVRLERLPPSAYDIDTAPVQLRDILQQNHISPASAKTTLNTLTSSEQGKLEGASEVSYDMVPMTRAMMKCACGLNAYLTQFKLDNVLTSVSFQNMEKLTGSSDYLQMTTQTIQNLELFNNATDGTTKGSLFALIDLTKTKFGSRHLRKWLQKPLCDKKKIEARLEAVSEILERNSRELERLYRLLQTLPDIQKTLCTILHKKCSTNEFWVTCKSLLSVLQTVTTIQTSTSDIQSVILNKILHELLLLLAGIPHWVTSINESAATEGKKSALFTDVSQFPAIASCKASISDIEGEIQHHLTEVRGKYAQCLHVPDYVTVSGTQYLLEVRIKDVGVIPKDWVNISSTKQVCRYHTPYIVHKVAELKLKHEELDIVSQEAWITFLESFCEEYGQLWRAVEHLAELDCLYALAELARQDEYTRPVFRDSDETYINIRQGRNPIVYSLSQDQSQYVANDTQLCGSGERCMVITGPNMGGKSSYIRQVAIMCILAHIGAYVPADYAELSVLDGVYIRMGATDDIFGGRSTFMVELSEASDIMCKATAKSLVVLDELGRGTSTHDGVAIAYATLRYFVSQIKCLTLFVTHYPPLVQLEKLYPEHVGVYHMSFMLDDTDPSTDATTRVIFLYQLVRGKAERSYGLNVARLADLPPQVIHIAAQKSQQLECIVKKRYKRDLFSKLFRDDISSTLHDLRSQLDQCGLEEET